MDKRINIVVTAEEHAKIKGHAYTNGMTVRDYITQLVRKDMTQHVKNERGN